MAERSRAGDPEADDGMRITLSGMKGLIIHADAYLKLFKKYTKMY